MGMHAGGTHENARGVMPVKYACVPSKICGSERAADNSNGLTKEPASPTAGKTLGQHAVVVNMLKLQHWRLHATCTVHSDTSDLYLTMAGEVNNKADLVHLARRF